MLYLLTLFFSLPLTTWASKYHIDEFEDVLEPDNVFIVSKKGDTVTEVGLGQHDLHTYFFDLLTKNSTKRLRYYAPEVLEKACPGKDGRQQAVKVKKLLLKASGKKSVFWTTSGHRTYREYPVTDYFQ